MFHANWVPVSIGCAALALLALAGCESNHYDVELKPDGDALNRKLTAWREKASDKNAVVAMHTSELQHLARAYDAPPPPAAITKHSFAGTFQGQMPNDLGGAGSFTHWESPLGTLSAYVERVRGNDDLAGEFAKRQASAEELANLLAGWLKKELAAAPQAEKAITFLEQDFKRDLMNVSLYAWALGNVAQSKRSLQEEVLVRVAQYLLERGYLSTDRLPDLMRALRELSHDHRGRMLSLAQRAIATRMGVAQDQPIPASLAFLGNVEKATASLDTFLRTTPGYAALERRWENERKLHPNAKAPDPKTVLGDLATSAFLPGSRFLGATDRLNVKLALATEPFSTNGDWDPKAQQVSWSHLIVVFAERKNELPTMLFAFWSQPDRDAQKRRFGAVVLDRENLAEYVAWYRGLTVDEAQQWDTFVATLKPGEDLESQLNRFRFRGEPPFAGVGDPGHEQSLSARPRELIQNGLKALNK